MDDKGLIRKRLENIKEKSPSYSGIIFRAIVGNSYPNNNFAYFGGIINPKKHGAKITLDDIVSAVYRYGIDTDEVIILLQYRKCKGMVIKYCGSGAEANIYLIGELEPHNGYYDLIL